LTVGHGGPLSLAEFNLGKIGKVKKRSNALASTRNLSITERNAIFKQFRDNFAAPVENSQKIVIIKETSGKSTLRLNVKNRPRQKNARKQ
jgi:hypothetical protein